LDISKDGRGVESGSGGRLVGRDNVAAKLGTELRFICTTCAVYKVSLPFLHLEKRREPS
jgi:hypothetical protein